MKRPRTLRVGLGFDAHILRRGRPLVLGGVPVPFPRGLAGHSDADVLLHAAADALLGAAALPDIGTIFPATDPQYKGADSARLLGRVVTRVRRLGWRVANLDCTLVCDGPRIAPHAAAIRTRVAGLVGIKPDAVGIKAKTTEGTMLARPGRSIAALVVVLLEPA
ncbi:2-C-methyl-D-erythritol 2,4-cyclodiphosphate synthase [candidate division WOR-3 bacterium]|nr:2-C-methyl-D-erythritol 2,4-cyclodiphosphate synthase [candidate division WOR-3 bacterium]